MSNINRKRATRQQSRRWLAKQLRKWDRCAYCDEPLDFESATVDHYYPLDLGGEDKPYNWRVACEDCNRLKSNRHPIEFHALVKARARPPAGALTGGIKTRDRFTGIASAGLILQTDT